jgi:hypothetical protein
MSTLPGSFAGFETDSGAGFGGSGAGFGGSGGGAVVVQAAASSNANVQITRFMTFISRQRNYYQSLGEVKTNAQTKRPPAREAQRVVID